MSAICTTPPHNGDSVRQFKDSKGDVWDIALFIGPVLAIKTKTNGKFDLLEPQSSELLKRLGDPAEFYELLWYLVEDQANQRGVTAIEFGKRLAAKCFVDARQQFVLEWADFFRDNQREDAAIALETHHQLMAVAIEEISQRIKEDTKGLVERAMPKMREVLNSASGSLQDALAQTLALTPSGS